MIELFTGFVGSGKSYHAVKTGVQVAEAPLSNKWVIANFPIKPKQSKINKITEKLFNKKFIKERKPRWIYKTNDELTVDFLINKSLEMGWDKKESSALVIFDEASIPFNSRNWNRPDRMEWIQFLTQSRKFGYDVIFITQDARLLDKQIRALCEYEVVHKKLNNMFGLGFLPFTVFGAVKYWNGLNARFTRGSLKLMIYNKKIAARYDTLKLFDYYDHQTQKGHV